MSSKIVGVVLSIAVVWPSLAADSSQWTNVQSLGRGDWVAVIQPDNKRIEGRFENATESAITLQTGAATTVARDKVTRVYKRGVSRSKRALIGLALGAGAGGALAAGIANGSNNEGFFGGGAVVAVTIVAASAIGAGFGALSGSGTKTVYRRATKP